MPAINYAKLTTPAEFKKAGENFTKRNVNLKADMQAAGICALEHMKQHGDYTSNMLYLLEASKSFGKNLHVAFQEWVLAFSWLTYDADAKAYSKDQSKDMDILGAKAQLWHEMERAAKAVPFDLQKAVDQLFAKVTKAVDAGDLDLDTVTATLVDKFEIAAPTAAIADQFAALDTDAKNALLASLAQSMIPAVEDEQRLAA